MNVFLVPAIIISADKYTEQGDGKFSQTRELGIDGEDRPTTIKLRLMGVSDASLVL